VSILAITIITYIVEDESADFGMTSWIYISLIFYVVVLMFLNKLILYENRIQIVHPFLKFRNKTIYLNDINTTTTDTGEEDYHIILKSGKRIRLSTILMRNFPEFQSKLNIELTQLHLPKN